MKKSSQIRYSDLTRLINPFLDSPPVRVIMDYYYEAPHADTSFRTKNLLMGYNSIINVLGENSILSSAPIAIKTIMDYCYTTTVKPVILGIKGTSLTAEEKLLFKTEHPVGIILFKRNIESVIINDPVTKKAVQVIQNKQLLLDLISSIKDELGEGVIIAID